MAALVAEIPGIKFFYPVFQLGFGHLPGVINHTGQDPGFMDAARPQLAGQFAVLADYFGESHKFGNRNPPAPGWL